MQNKQTNKTENKNKNDNMSSLEFQCSFEMLETPYTLNNSRVTLLQFLFFSLFRLLGNQFACDHVHTLIQIKFNSSIKELFGKFVLMVEMECIR